MLRIYITLFIAIIFHPNLKAEDIEVDTPEKARELSSEYRVTIEESDTRYFQCQDVIVDFLSIRSEMGIQSVQLLSYESNGKISFQMRIHSSHPTQIPSNPDEKLPELTKDSRDRAYLCVPKELINKSQLIITYGYPDAMCYRDRVTLHLDAFLANNDLKPRRAD